MKFKNKHIAELSEYLKGSNKSLDKGIIELFGNFDSSDLSEANLKELKKEVSLCENCSFWWDTSEISEDRDNICIECNN
tara:strand:+ start:24730 stop:24966 length:237 start_codon:yes stop_codon:yes gene_type:complete